MTYSLKNEAAIKLLTGESRLNERLERGIEEVVSSIRETETKIREIFVGGVVNQLGLVVANLNSVEFLLDELLAKMEVKFKGVEFNKYETTHCNPYISLAAARETLKKIIRELEEK